MKTEINTAVQALANSDEASLYARLGGYAMTYPTAPSSFSAPGAEVPVNANTAGPVDDLIAIGKRILRRWQKIIFELVCGGDEVGIDKQVKKTILDALKLNSGDALATAITGVLIGVFSVGPAVAVVVGVLFGKIFLPAAGQEVCGFWKEKMA